MRRLIVAVLALMLAAPAPSAGQQMPLPSCYGGLMGGTAIANARLASAGESVTIAASGLAITFAGGCDVRHDRYVAGLIARYEITDVSARVFDGAVGLDNIWTLGARAGYLVNPHVLAYGLAGISGTKLEFGPETVAARGLTLGAGLEIALPHNLALVAEYSHTGLGRKGDADVSIHPDVHAVRMGLTYRFGSIFGDAKK